MNTKQALVDATRVLFSFSNPKLEAEVILCWICKCSRAQLRMHSDRDLSFVQQQIFYRSLRRRAQHIPVAYIMGYKLWNDMKLRVTPNTLIPRDETEILVETIQTKTKDIPESVLDVGTGSGAIAIAMAHIYPEAQITAIDISPQALAVARQNARAQRTQINFIHADLLSSIDEGDSFDCIIANLPYVPESVSVTSEVEKEPHSAIFAPEEGLLLIRQLRDQLQQKKIRFRNLWLEFLPIQKEAIADLFSDYQVVFHTDAGGDVFFAQIITS